MDGEGTLQSKLDTTAVTIFLEVTDKTLQPEGKGNILKCNLQILSSTLFFSGTVNLQVTER